MESFQKIAKVVIPAMEKRARTLGAKGVIIIAQMTKDGMAWESQMKVVDAMTLIPSDPENHTYPGYNFLGIAATKAAEMADTRVNSGSVPSRKPLQGEFGYPGGLISEIPEGYLLAVFSGASGDQDSEISQAGLDAYSQELAK